MLPRLHFRPPVRSSIHNGTSQIYPLHKTLRPSNISRFIIDERYTCPPINRLLCYPVNIGNSISAQVFGTVISLVPHFRDVRANALFCMNDTKTYDFSKALIKNSGNIRMWTCVHM